MSNSTTKPIRSPVAAAPATTLHPPPVAQIKGKERLLTRLQSISSPRPTFLTANAPPPSPSALGRHDAAFPPIRKQRKRVRINRKAIKVRLITWNMCETLPTGSLAELLGFESAQKAQEDRLQEEEDDSESEEEGDLPQFKGNGHPYHLIVVAAQECPTASGVVNGKLPINFSGKGWSSMLESWLCAEPEGAEIRIDHQLPPSPSRPTTPIPPVPSTLPLPVADPSASTSQLADATTSETDSTDEKPFHYVLASKERLLPGIFLAVFVSVSCQHLLTDISTSRVATGLLSGRIGNKGGIGTSLVFGGQRLLFLCVHLAAHAGEKYNELRKAMLVRIFNELDMDDFSSSSQTRSIEGSIKEEEGEKALAERWDQIFVMGDMNFRLDITRSHADWLLKTKDYANALKFDQLNKYLSDPTSVLAGFSERTPEFPPTYKYDVKKPVAAPANGHKRPSLSRNKSTTPNGLLKGDIATKEKNGLGLDGVPAAAPMMKMESLEEGRENQSLAIAIPLPKSNGNATMVNGATPKVSASPSLTIDEHDMSASDRDSICSALSDDADDLLSPHPHHHSHPRSHPLPPIPTMITTLSESTPDAQSPISPKKKKHKNRFKKILKKVRVMNMLRPPTHDQTKVDNPVREVDAAEGTTKTKGEVEMIEEQITLAKLVEEEVFDSSAKKRVQSYTDRILFKSNVAYGRPDYVPPRPPSPPPMLPTTIGTSGTPILGPRNFSAAIVDFIKHPTQAKPGFRRNASSSSTNAVPTLADSRVVRGEVEEGPSRRRSQSKGRVSFGSPKRSQSLAVPPTSFSSPFHFSNPFSTKNPVVFDSPGSIEVDLPASRKSMTAERTTGDGSLARSTSLVRFSSLGRSRSLANSVATSSASNRGYFWSRRRNKSLSTPGERDDPRGSGEGGKRGVEFTRSRTNPVVYDTPLGATTTPPTTQPGPTTSFLKNLLHLPPIAYLSTLISTLPLSSPPLTNSPLHSPFGLDPSAIGEVAPPPPKKRIRKGPRRGEILMEYYDSVRGLGGSDHRAVVGVAFIGVEEEGVEESWIG